jgi:hypothetical protein
VFPLLVLSDSFHDVDGTAITAHKPTVDLSPSAGQHWALSVPGFFTDVGAIEANTFVCDANNVVWAQLDAGSLATGNVQIVQTCAFTTPGNAYDWNVFSGTPVFLGGLQAATNAVLLGLFGTQLTAGIPQNSCTLWTDIGGVTTVIATTPWVTDFVGHTLKLVVVGTTATGYLDGVQQVTGTIPLGTSGRLAGLLNDVETTATAFSATILSAPLGGARDPMEDW